MLLVSLDMASGEHSWSERIRDLIEQVEKIRNESDRVRGESERVRGQAERAMKDPFWPDRRREPRFPTSDEPHGHDRRGA